MVREDRWQEIHRLFRDERMTIAEIGRQLDLDRKTVRRCLRQAAWKPYARPAAMDTPLARHTRYLRERAPVVGYSAQVLFQELIRWDHLDHTRAPHCPPPQRDGSANERGRHNGLAI